MIKPILTIVGAALLAAGIFGNSKTKTEKANENDLTEGKNHAKVTPADENNQD